MTRCTATAELVNANGESTGIYLHCELERGHDRHTGTFMGQPAMQTPTEHRASFKWADPTPAELAEAVDPDESFDLEVDIAPDEVRNEQIIATALQRCSVCGLEAEPDHLSTFGYRHADRTRRPYSHAARVA